MHQYIFECICPSSTEVKLPIAQMELHLALAVQGYKHFGNENSLSEKADIWIK